MLCVTEQKGIAKKLKKLFKTVTSDVVYVVVLAIELKRAVGKVFMMQPKLCSIQPIQRGAVG